MFRIDKELVENMNINKEFVVIVPKKNFKEAPPDQEKKPQNNKTDKELLCDANKEAQSIISDAQSQAEEIRQAAREEGYKEGKEEARQEMEALIATQTKDAKEVFKKIELYKQDLYNNFSNNILGLSFDIAEKIINIHLKRDDTIYVEITKKAIKALNSSAEFALHVSRSEYDRFFAEGAQWLSDDIGGTPFEVVCDSYMAEGGCIVESEEGVVNAGVSEQLDKLKRIMDGGFGPSE